MLKNNLEAKKEENRLPTEQEYVRIFQELEPRLPTIQNSNLRQIRTQILRENYQITGNLAQPNLTPKLAYTLENMLPQLDTEYISNLKTLTEKQRRENELLVKISKARRRNNTLDEALIEINTPQNETTDTETKKQRRTTEIEQELSNNRDNIKQWETHLIPIQTEVTQIQNAINTIETTTLTEILENENIQPQQTYDLSKYTILLPEQKPKIKPIKEPTPTSNSTLPQEPKKTQKKPSRLRKNLDKIIMGAMLTTIGIMGYLLYKQETKQEPIYTKTQKKESTSIEPTIQLIPEEYKYLVKKYNLNEIVPNNSGAKLTITYTLINDRQYTRIIEIPKIITEDNIPDFKISFWTRTLENILQETYQVGTIINNHSTESPYQINMTGDMKKTIPEEEYKKHVREMMTKLTTTSQININGITYLFAVLNNNCFLNPTEEPRITLSNKPEILIPQPQKNKFLHRNNSNEQFEIPLNKEDLDKLITTYIKNCEYFQTTQIPFIYIDGTPLFFELLPDQQYSNSYIEQTIKYSTIPVRMNARDIYPLNLHFKDNTNLDF